MLGRVEGPGGCHQRQLPLHVRGAGLPARRCRRLGRRLPRSLRAGPGRGARRPATAACARRGRRRLRYRTGGRIDPLRAAARECLARPPTAPLVPRRPIRGLHGWDHRQPEGCAVAPGRLPAHRARHRGNGRRARRSGTPAGSTAGAPGATVHARCRPLERAVVPARRGHGRDPGPHRAPRPGRRARHLRTSSGHLAAHRGRRVRPSVARRAPATTTRPVLAGLPDDRRCGPVPHHQAAARRRGAGPPGGRHPRLVRDRTPRPGHHVLRRRRRRPRRLPSQRHHRGARRVSDPHARARRARIGLVGPAGSCAPRLPRRSRQDGGHVPAHRRRRPRGGRRSCPPARRRPHRAARAATRSPSTPAARRCTPRRSSRRSRLTRACTTPWSSGDRASAGAARSSPSWPSPTTSTPTTSDVVAGQHLARYKLPKSFVVVDRVRRSASGKPDYAWARQVAQDDAGRAVTGEG